MHKIINKRWSTGNGFPYSCCAESSSIQALPSSSLYVLEGIFSYLCSRNPPFPSFLTSLPLFPLSTAGAGTTTTMKEGGSILELCAEAGVGAGLATESQL